MQLRETEKLYIYSMGKKLRVTAIFDNDAEANAFMAARPNEAVIASFGKYVFTADRYDNGTAA